MPECFQSDYANFYDLLYQEKEYERECDVLCQAFERFAAEKPATILDVGCGTGGHALPLARRGFRVTGVDASEAMLAVARRKAGANLPVTFHCGLATGLDLGTRFDAALCLFNVIDYLTTDDELRRALRRIREHLISDGLFLFDFRHGVPSLRSYSPARVKWAGNQETTLLRLSETTLDAAAQLHCTTYTCIVFQGEQPTRRFQETHVLHYLFPAEVKRFLAESGFALVQMSGWFDLDAAPSDADWNVLVVARAA